MMALSHLLRGVAWIAPTLVLAPLLMGANGQGCSPGVVTCTPADCKDLSAPAEVCPDGTATGPTCVAQPDGHCSWGPTPACPVVDAGTADAGTADAGTADAGTADACSGIALPCVPCVYGSLGTGKDANGCDTCPICAPEPDAAAIICNCPNIPVPSVCPDGSPQPTTTGSAPCFCEQVEACPAAESGASSCSGNADCPTGSACGFAKADGCAAKGKCFGLPGFECDAIELGCACDGSQINLICNGLPSGDAPKPFRHTGACTDGG
jgi:hypothetical protein